MQVLVTLVFDGDDDCVRLSLHYLHPDVRAALGCMPCTPAAREMLHRITARRVRALLHYVDAIAVAQRSYEASQARQHAALGHRAVLRRVLHPFVLHDACTLYLACASDAFGGDSWLRAAPCTCGSEWRGTTCTPPRLTRAGRLTRDVGDVMITFCVGCLRRGES